MSLQVWLPLNGNLDNQGLTSVTVTNNGATVDNNGKIGKCYSFDGSDDYIRYAGIDISGWTQLSISCWVYFTSTLKNVFGFSDPNSYWQFIVYNNTLEIRDNGTGQSGTRKSYSLGTNTADTWIHFCFTYNSGVVNIYRNGELLSTNNTGGTCFNSNVNICTIGSNWASGTPSYCFPGKINDFRVYDHVLSAQEVKKLAQGLILHYPLASPSDVLVPEGYQQLEYIESTGTAWLNTGYTFNPETDACKIIFKGNDTSNNGMIFASNGGNNKYFWLYYYQGGMNIYATDNSGSQRTVAGPSRDTNKHTAIYNNKHYYFDGVDEGALIGSYIINTDSIYLFGYSNTINYAFKGRIYYVEIARNNVMQKIFVPAKRLSDNAIGMYEIYGKNFIPSMTSTAFTAGPNTPVSSPVYDISGYKNHGTVVGNLTAAADTPRYKSCIVNNDTSYITCPQLFGEIQTISFWLKSDKSNGCFIIEPNSKLGFCISNHLLLISRWLQLTYDATSFISDEWNHIVLVKTGESTALLYINGVEITARGSNSNNIAHTVSVPWLFWRSYNENYHGIGSMSDVRIYVTALSADEVAELYALGQV